MSRIRSASIVILLTPPLELTEHSSTDEYSDFEEIHVEPERDGSDEESQESQDFFLETLSDRALKAAGRSDKVVVRYETSSSQGCQESLVKRLIAGGASHENITVVRHALDHSTKKQQRSGSFYSTNYCTWRPKTMLA